MKQNIKQVALLGTSADPPTQGHQALLEGLSTIFPKVVTWASDNPLKAHSTSLSQRHELLYILVKDLGLQNLEINQSLSSPWAIKTIEKAEQLWPQDELVLIVGSDLAKQIPTWVQPKDLFKKARLGIAPRTGWPMNQLDIKTLKALGGKIDLLPLTIPDTASSSIRSKPKLSNIPKSIRPILLRKKLYGLSTTEI